MASMCPHCLSASCRLRRPRLTSNRGYPIPQASRLEPQAFLATPVTPLRSVPGVPPRILRVSVSPMKIDVAGGCHCWLVQQCGCDWTGMATPLRGEAMAPRCRFHPPGRRHVMTTPWFSSSRACMGRARGTQVHACLQGQACHPSPCDGQSHVTPSPRSSPSAPGRQSPSPPACRRCASARPRPPRQASASPRGRHPPGPSTSLAPCR